MDNSINPNVKINRDAPVRLFPFSDFFQGFDNVTVVRALFGEKTEKVLDGLKVEFFSMRFGYMGVSDVDGHLFVSTHHLKNSEFRTLYLDVVHELHHVKQFSEGRELFSEEYEYVDSPVEIEAYLKTVEEARRIGMSDKEIIEYLKVEWINDSQHQRLVEKMGLNPSG